MLTTETDGSHSPPGWSNSQTKYNDDRLRSWPGAAIQLHLSASALTAAFDRQIDSCHRYPILLELRRLDSLKVRWIAVTKLSRLAIGCLLAKNARKCLTIMTNCTVCCNICCCCFFSVTQSVLCKRQCPTVLCGYPLTTISDMYQEIVAKTLQVWIHACGYWPLIAKW